MATDDRDPPFTPTVPALVDWCVEQHGDLEFLVEGESRRTYAEVRDAVADLAAGLVAAGVGKGTRVGLVMGNTAAWIECWLATATIGALFVPLSTLSPPDELGRLVRHTDVHTLLVQQRLRDIDLVDRLERALPGLDEHGPAPLFLPSHPYLRQIVVWGDARRPWARRGPDDLHALRRAHPRIDCELVTAIASEVTPADPHLLVTTSGTTAAPKSVQHTHGNSLRQAWAARAYTGIRRGEAFYTASPLFWVGGLAAALLPTMFAGAKFVMSEDFAPDAMVRLIERERVAVVGGWPTRLAAMRKAAAEIGADLSATRRGIVDLVDDEGNRVPPHRIPNSLGMTETFGMHSFEPFGTVLEPGREGSFGRALAGVERRIIDPVTGDDVPTGASGELLLRGISLMDGIYKRERAETFDPDGWYHTGDRCRQDDAGHLYFEGRTGEMIKSSGANVAPREVELALEALDGIREAIVFGVPHDDRGEAVAAVVVLADGHDLDVDATRRALRERLSSYKVPTTIVALPDDEMPRASTGKVQKHLLRDRVRLVPQPHKPSEDNDADNRTRP